jgi:hypothetical protein
MRINARTVCPPGGWRFRLSDGFTVREFGAWDHFYRVLCERAIARNLPPPSRAEIEQFICDDLGEDSEAWCSPSAGEPRTLRVYHDCAKITLQTLISTTSLLIDAARGDAVSTEEAERRAAICATCSQNRDIQGCMGCSARGLTELAVKASGSGTLREPLKLRTCCVCGCWLRSKVWISHDVIAKHMSDKQRAMLNERAPQCWMLEERV